VCLEVAYRDLTGGISGVTHVQRQQKTYFSERRITKYLFVGEGSAARAYLLCINIMQHAIDIVRDFS
jgi:hypothetical protein